MHSVFNLKVNYNFTLIFSFHIVVNDKKTIRRFCCILFCSDRKFLIVKMNHEIKFVCIELYTRSVINSNLSILNFLAVVS